MAHITRVLGTTLSGAAICAALSFIAFVSAALFDGTRARDALGYGLIVGMAAAVLGGMIGFVVGVGKLGVIGGAIVGLLATVAVVALYVLAFGQPERLGYFLNESRVFVAFLALPLAATGALTARLRRTPREHTH